MGTKLDIRYVAGLVDGEGCISIYVEKRAPRSGQKRPAVVVHFTVEMTHAGIIQALHEQFGGSIYHRKTSRNPNAKERYCWNISQRSAVPLLKRLLPHLRVKKQQAELALKLMCLTQIYRNTLMGRPYGRGLSDLEYNERLSIVAECSILNKKGR